MTTIEELQNRINDLQAELNQLKNQQENKNKKQKPERNDDYFYIDYFGDISKEENLFTEVDKFRYKIGNYFKTQEEAQEYLDNTITKAKLKALAEELNEGKVIDWDDFSQRKYYMCANYQPEKLYFGEETTAQTAGVIYFLDSNFLNEAINRIGKERLIKMIKSGL